VAVDGPAVVLDVEGGTASSRVHARYRRRPLDLPWRGHPVRLALTVQRFACANPACGAAPSARRPAPTSGAARDGHAAPLPEPRLPAEGDPVASSVPLMLGPDLVCPAVPYALARHADGDRSERRASACTDSGYRSFGTSSKRMAAG
jgi:hypothetical protein